MFNFQQLDMSLVMLFILLGCGIISQNSTIIISAGLLIVLKMLPFSDTVLPYLESHGLNLGIIILTIGVLAPIATGKISGDAMLKSFVSWQSLIAIVVGVFVAWLGGRGVKLMSDDPSVVSGLLVGTVIGVAFLRGVPVGPLIAAGMVSLFYSLK